MTGQTAPPVEEYSTKPCSVEGCTGTMVFSLRAWPVGALALDGVRPRPGWLCGKDRRHIEWGAGDEKGGA